MGYITHLLLLLSEIVSLSSKIANFKLYQFSFIDEAFMRLILPEISIYSSLFYIRTVLAYTTVMRLSPGNLLSEHKIYNEKWENCSNYWTGTIYPWLYSPLLALCHFSVVLSLRSR
jgi:hypothetical protein